MTGTGDQLQSCHARCGLMNQEAEVNVLAIFYSTTLSSKAINVVGPENQILYLLFQHSFRSVRCWGTPTPHIQTYSTLDNSLE